MRYNQSHKVNNKGELLKKCNKHKIYFEIEDEWLPCTEEYFYKANNKSDGLNPCCIECAKKKQSNYIADNKEEVYKKKTEYDKTHKEQSAIKKKRWKQNNPDRVTGNIEKWYKKNPEKHKEYNQKHRNHDITKQEWLDCKKVFNYRCAYCGLPIEDHWITMYGKEVFSDFHKEHVDDDGYNDLRNCIPSCKSCNSSKWKHSMDDWYKSQTFFSQDKLDFINWWTIEGYKNYIEDKPPYRIMRKQNEGLTTYHYELWSIDKKRNFIECIDTSDKKKDLDLLKILL